MNDDELNLDNFEDFQKLSEQFRANLYFINDNEIEQELQCRFKNM